MSFELTKHMYTRELGRGFKGVNAVSIRKYSIEDNTPIISYWQVCKLALGLLPIAVLITVGFFKLCGFL